MKQRLFALALILSSIALSLHAQPELLRPSLEASLERIGHPSDIGEFSPVFHFPPRNQDTTNCCWSFATCSFLETEMQRVGGKSVALSPMYFAYYAFIEKTKEIVRTKGVSRFSEGDLFSGVLSTVKAYGIIPLSAYPGQTRQCPTYNNEPLMKELEASIAKIKRDSVWNEAEALAVVTPILDKYLGRPPAAFIYEGASYTPETFRDKVVALPWDEYVLVTSFLYAPFHQKTELKVPDNWKHRADFYNVPLDEFSASLAKAVKAGYSVAFDADISEPSYRLTKEFAFIPDFDLPSGAVTPEAREFRFQNGSTTDDHLMHIVGYVKNGNDDWFMVKDSWRTAHQGPLKGYILMHESFVKMKVLAYLVHKDAVKGLVR
ncbi:MAG: C1 family peptidase [Acidobacteriota bacterium]